MTGKPSLYQGLILHHIQDDRIWLDGGHWWDAGTHHDHKVTLQVNKLIQLGLVVYKPEAVPHLSRNGLLVTVAGVGALAARPYKELIDKMDKRHK